MTEKEIKDDNVEKIHEHNIKNENPEQEEITTTQNTFASNQDSNEQEIDANIEQEDDKYELEQTEKINWEELSKIEILTKVKELINNLDILTIKDNIINAKNEFYKKHNQEIEKIKEKYLTAQTKEDDNDYENAFEAPKDSVEHEFKQYINIYSDKRNEKKRELEQEKQNNLKRKLEIIEEIKNLVNTTEKTNIKFTKFKELEQEFNNLGQIPTKDLKQVWSSFNVARELFYDFLRIDKELRDLHYKKNLDQKQNLIEKAKELLKNTDIIESHKKLQELHTLWKKTGPVAPDKKEEIWNVFSDLTKQVNKKHQDFFEKLKEEKIKNLELKEKLCEKIEEIKDGVYKTMSAWNEKAKEIEEIQQEWKQIGPTPKNTNKEIYKRFRDACDIFFDLRKQFYAEIKKEQQVNLQKKYELCEKVEELQNNEDWKETTNKIIKLQKEWKKIGPVPRKKSEQVWNRFRAACDTFFNRKKEHFVGQNEQETENLKLKQALIEKLEKYEQKEDVNETIEDLKDFQTQWKKIGFVPIDKKKEINTKFKNLLNNLYDKLKIDTKEKDIIRLKSKLEDLITHKDGIEKLKHEKDKLLKRISDFEKETVLLENNIGFFNNTKNAEHLLKDVKNKINTAKENIELLKEKIKLINQYINKENKKN